jgi:hypothetical protein
MSSPHRHLVGSVDLCSDRSVVTDLGFIVLASRSERSAFDVIVDPTSCKEEDGRRNADIAGDPIRQTDDKDAKNYQYDLSVAAREEYPALRELFVCVHNHVGS